MILGFKIFMFIIIFVSFLGTIAEDVKDGKIIYASLCIAAMLSLTVTLIFL